jgi:serine/threonine protein kinase
MFPVIMSPPDRPLELQSLGPVLSSAGRNGDISVGVALVTDSTSSQLVRKCVAVKCVRCLPTDRIRLQAHEAEFIQIVTRYSNLYHPNICAPLAVCRIRGIPAIVTLMYRDGDILNYFSRNPTIDKTSAILGVALGVAHLHDLSIFHGHLVPRNIMISDDGKAVVTDIGYSAYMNGNRIYDWQHVPPQELIAGTTNPPSATKDVFSLGTTIFKVIPVLVQPFVPVSILDSPALRFLLGELLGPSLGGNF